MYQGALAPESFIMVVTPGSSGVNMNNISAATFEVRKSNGSTTSWSATLSNQSSTSLTLTHIMNAMTSELDVVGTYNVYASMTHTSGTVASVPVELIVKDSYDPT